MQICLLKNCIYMHTFGIFRKLAEAQWCIYDVSYWSN